MLDANAIGQSIIALIAIGGFLANYFTQAHRKRDTDRMLEVIRVDVNSNLTHAMNRIAALEKKLGLASGEDIPL